MPLEALVELRDVDRVHPKEPVDTAAEFKGLAKTHTLNEYQVAMPREKGIDVGSILDKAISS